MPSSLNSRYLNVTVWPFLKCLPSTQYGASWPGLLVAQSRAIWIGELALGVGQARQFQPLALVIHDQGTDLAQEPAAFVRLPAAGEAHDTGLGVGEGLVLEDAAMALGRPNGLRVANHHALAALVEHPLQVLLHLVAGRLGNVDQLRLRMEVADRGVGVFQGLAQHGHFLAERLVGREELEVVAQAALRDGNALEATRPAQLSRCLIHASIVR